MREEKGPVEPLTTRDIPSTPGTDEEKSALEDRCGTDREDMAPHETADCAGERLSEAYENEEDGGT